MPKTTNLSQYNAVRHLMQPGDVIAFAGRAVISYLIDAFSGSNLSHVAVVKQGYYDLACGDNFGQTLYVPREYGMSDLCNLDVQITQSTIEDGKSGPQTDPLARILEEYGDKCQAWWLPLADDVRKVIDWQKFYARIAYDEAHVEYDVPGLFGFLGRSVPILGPRIAQGESAKRMFCSAYAVDLLEYAGALRGINCRKTSPQDLCEMHMFKDCVQILGKPGVIRRFNTI